MSGDSIDRVIEEWEALACAHGVSRKSYGDVEFRRVAGLAHTAAAAWAPNAAPYILGIIGPDSDRGAQFRKGTLADLRAALGLSAWVAPPAPAQEEEERAEAAEIALTIRLNPNAAGSIPGTDWQVDYPGQYSSHPNAQAAWIEAGIVLGVLDDGEGVAGLTRELLTRVEQIEALLVKRAQELEEVRKQLLQTEMAEAAEANTQILVAAHKEQVTRLLDRAETAEADLAAFRNVHDAACCARNSARDRANRAEAAIRDAAAREQELVAAHKEQVERLLLQQAASLKWERERDAARLRVGELEWEVGRMETELSIERDAARREIEWLKRAWMACRRVICEMSDVQAAREELTDATRRLSAAQAERHEAEREPNDQW